MDKLCLDKPLTTFLLLLLTFHKLLHSASSVSARETPELSRKKEHELNECELFSKLLFFLIAINFGSSLLVLSTEIDT